MFSSPRWFCFALLLPVACGGISQAERNATSGASDQAQPTGGAGSAGGTAGTAPVFSESADASQLPACSSGGLPATTAADPSDLGSLYLSRLGDQPSSRYDGEVVVGQSDGESLVLELQPPAASLGQRVKITWDTQLGPPLATGVKLWLSLEYDEPGFPYAAAWSVRDRNGGTLLFGQTSDRPLGAFRMLGGSDVCAQPTYYCGYAGERYVQQLVQVQADQVTTVMSGDSPTLPADGREYRVRVSAWRAILPSQPCGGAAADARPHYGFSARLSDLASVLGNSASP